MKVPVSRLSFLSLVKIGLISNMIGWMLAALLLVIAEFAGAGLLGQDRPGLPAGLLMGVVMGVTWGALTSLVYVAGALLARLLLRPGYAIELREDPDALARRFE